MPLTFTEIINSKTKEKTYRLYDQGGLYLEITGKGRKYWRYKYYYLKKEKRLALGVFPEVGLKEARLARDAAKQLLAKGIDPSAERQARKQREVELIEHSFAMIAHEWHVKHNRDLSPEYSKRLWRALEKDIFPVVGRQPISMITGPHLLRALMNIEEREARESAHRALQICARVYGYANAKGYTDKDPTRGLKAALAPHKTKHFAHFTDPKDVGGLMRAIDGYENIITRSALLLAAYTFTRPANIRKAEWSEFNFEDQMWKIPAEKMKMRKPHLIPLSNQVIDLLEILRELTSQHVYLFPNTRNRKEPMSDGTLIAALRRMGYDKEQMCIHGFRHMASTLLNEQGIWNPDAIERQLAHTDRSKIRATYDHSKHLNERKVLMQAYADHLDHLKSPGQVIPLHSNLHG